MKKLLNILLILLLLLCFGSCASTSSEEIKEHEILANDLNSNSVNEDLMTEERKNELLERFVRYTAVDTMSIPSENHPSFDGEWDLLRMLEQELKDFGVKDVVLTDKGILVARIPANTKGAPTIGFMSHVDTANDVEGNHVKARVIESYDGKDIKLNEKVTLDVESNPELSQYKGTTLIVTDGNTLLGGDDKTGIAEIMTAIKYLQENPEVKHGEIEIYFNADEETGLGMDCFPYDKVKSAVCYTIDGAARYEVQFECWNAATVELRFEGRTVHIGHAKNKLINAIKMANAFIDALPQSESPEATDGRDGFYCPYEIKGTTEEATLTLIIRDFDYDNLLRRIDAVKKMAEAVEALYHGKVEVNEIMGYRNLYEAVKKNPRSREIVFEAGKALGMPLVEIPIRGGTDGAQLSQVLGIPCPNLFTGSHNLHSIYEWAALEAMSDSVELILKIVDLWAEE